MTSRMNNMELHDSKFEVLSYALNRSKLLRELPFYSANVEYTTPNGHVIDLKDTVKNLGVHLSSKSIRSWTPHIINAAKEHRKLLHGYSAPSVTDQQQ